MMTVANQVLHLTSENHKIHHMKLQQADRIRSHIKMALQGPSGSGKTYSALLLARGLTESWERIAVVDTESGSSNLYSHLGPYKVLQLELPYTPERYIEAIQMCSQEADVIIVDSISQCWECLLDFHSKLPGNSFTNWARVTPRHQAFVNAILHVPSHVICTMRTKQDYVLNEKNGKQVPEKVGLKAVQRDGIDYDFTLVFDLDLKHFVRASKDRTGLFMDRMEDFVIDESIGQKILKWTQEGSPGILEEILACEDLDDLKALYERVKPSQGPVYDAIRERKGQLQSDMPIQPTNP
jgi:nucleoside-triphosphatase THEP1